MKIFKKILKILGICILALILVAFIKQAYDRKHLTEDSKLSVVYSYPELKSLKKYLIYTGNNNTMEHLSHFTKIKDVDVNGNVLLGVERVREVMNDGGELVSLYTDEECLDDEEKANVNLLYFPAETENVSKPFVIVVAGGGYMAVSNLLESYPVAAKWNELGYPVFVLNYRVQSDDALFPKPMEDVAKAVEYIYNNYESYNLSDSKEYIIGGFSAGGHISAEWGTKNEGYEKYGLQAPAAIFLGYPAISSTYFVAPTEEDEEAMLEFRQHIVGKNITEETENEYSVDKNVDADYPPTYIVYCADDDMVDPIQSKSMVEALESAGVMHLVEEGEHGGHGFATGMGTSVEGWMERADKFFMTECGLNTVH